MATHKQLLTACDNAYKVAPAPNDWSFRDLATNLVFKNRFAKSIPLVNKLELVKGPRQQDLVESKPIKPIDGFVQLAPPVPNEQSPILIEDASRFMAEKHLPLGG
jgi:hypothetical protein